MWSYPRPPALEAVDRSVRVELAGLVVAESPTALRVLETSHPPTYYVPPDSVDRSLLAPALGRSFCEWKGIASYWTVVAGGEERVGRAWSYASPSASFAALANHVSFYPADFDCFVDGLPVTPQPGTFYGGWVTSDVVGPFKGEPGSEWW